MELDGASSEGTFPVQDSLFVWFPASVQSAHGATAQGAKTEKEKYEMIGKKTPDLIDQELEGLSVRHLLSSLHAFG